MLELLAQSQLHHEGLVQITKKAEAATTAILKNTDATLVVISGGMIGKFIDHFQSSTFGLLKTKDTGGQYSEDFYKTLQSQEFKEYVSGENYLDLKTEDLIRWAQENNVNSFTSEAEGKDIVKPAPVAAPAEAEPAPVAAPAEAKPAPVAAPAPEAVPSPVAAAATADAATAAATADAAATATTAAATPGKQLTNKEKKATGKATGKADKKQKKAAEKAAKAAKATADKAAKAAKKKVKKNNVNVDPGAPATPVAVPSPVAATPVGEKTVTLNVTLLKGDETAGVQIDVAYTDLDSFKAAVVGACKQLEYLSNNDTVKEITYFDIDFDGWTEVDADHLDEIKDETKIQVAYTSK